MIQPVFAEEEIEGLHENLSSLFLENYFTQEEIDDMQQQYIDDFNGNWDNIYRDFKMSGKLNGRSEKQLYWDELNFRQLNFSNAVRVSLLWDYKYAEQYAEQGVFPYLFSGEEYWSVPGYDVYSNKAKFDNDGNMIKNVIEEFRGRYAGFIVDNETTIDYIKNEDNIKSMLIEKGENIVTDMKLFAVNDMTFLYIKCLNNEYLLKLYISTSYKTSISDELYLLPDLIELIIPNSVSTIKPTYEAEATALAEEGLLYGNENGLDLLKPMTRIEAVTMILRAIGNTSTAAASAFSDVPAWHWGYNAANVAYEHGITSGIGNGEFAPERTITAEEFSAMILRLTDIGDFDWQNSVNILVEQGIISTDDARTMDLFTRGDMAKIIYEIRAHGLL